jgi:hypothetical protein
MQSINQQGYDPAAINEEANRARLRIENILTRMNVDLVKVGLSPLSSICTCDLQQSDNLLDTYAFHHSDWRN